MCVGNPPVWKKELYMLELRHRTVEMGVCWWWGWLPVQAVFPIFYPVLEFRILDTRRFLPASLPPPNFILRRIYSVPVPPRFRVGLHRLKYLQGQDKQWEKVLLVSVRDQEGGWWGRWWTGLIQIEQLPLSSKQPVLPDLLIFRKGNTEIQAFTRISLTQLFKNI